MVYYVNVSYTQIKNRYIFLFSNFYQKLESGVESLIIGFSVP